VKIRILKIETPWRRIGVVEVTLPWKYVYVSIGLIYVIWMYLREYWMAVDSLGHYYIGIPIEWLTKTTEPSIGTVETRTGDLDDYETNPVNPGGLGGSSAHRTLTSYSKTNIPSPHRDLNLGPSESNCVPVATTGGRGGRLNWSVYTNIYLLERKIATSSQSGEISVVLIMLKK
jgi:hypothetical protein